MEYESSYSSSSDDDDEVIVLLNSIIVIAAHSINSNSTDSADSDNKWGGSPKGKYPNNPRDFEGAYNMLICHYFSSDKSLNNEATFERRFVCHV